MSGTHRVREEGQRTHFAMIPNLVDDLNLSQKAYRLYGHLKRVAGEKGRCEEGVDAMAKKCRMNKDTLIAAKRELVASKLVTINPSKDRTKPDEIVILDVWDLNAEHFSKEERVPNEGTRASQTRERDASEKRERKKREVQKSIKDNPPTSPRYKPSQSECQEKCEAFFSTDPLAEAVRDVADRAAEKNRNGEMSWSRIWNGFITPIVESRSTHSEETIRYALQETNRLEKDDMRYALAVMRNTPKHASNVTPIRREEREGEEARDSSRFTRGFEFLFEGQS